MKTFGPKQDGRCLECRCDVYEIREVFKPDHPMAGEPSRLGRQLPNGTQVRFLLTNGATADISFCDDCARALEPADYWPVWQACVARLDRGLALAGRSENVRRHERAAALTLWPLAIVARRRESPDGIPTLDTR